ncbi:hypothetical protein [Cryobacterium tagatosivorans]|uniref:Cupin domain-containing protein n=1 Tax=Cryobacterium tagatosivorans TaxID=1259199 RepID=A0A4R8UGG8_9MICO|nr:hypothetical protein [Cryobacterium tagatosivorans]TFB54687.1 hypothetical protein E3O23_03375 [Cryobacterium tagatosivorans]
MPKLSRDDQANLVTEPTMPGYETRYTVTNGYVMDISKYPEAADFTPYYRGLPEDRCQGTHWGYVIRGQLTIHRPEGDEVFNEGDAYIITPNHTPEVVAGTELVEFTSEEDATRTMAVVTRNMQGASDTD